MEGVYRDPIDKIWLAIQSTQVAKSQAVDEFGIGEELQFNLYGWVDDRLAIICGTDPSMHSDREARFQAILEAAIITRRGWGVTAFTFIAEGFCAINLDDIDRKRPLHEQYLQNNSVAECLCFMHIEQDEVQILTVPFKYGLGRTVSYGLPIRYTDDEDISFVYPRMIQKALELEVMTDDLDPEAFFEALAYGLMEKGIHCQWNL